MLNKSVVFSCSRFDASDQFDGARSKTAAYTWQDLHSQDSPVWVILWLLLREICKPLLHILCARAVHFSRHPAIG